MSDLNDHLFNARVTDIREISTDSDTKLVISFDNNQKLSLVGISYSGYGYLNIELTKDKTTIVSESICCDL